MKKEKCVRVKYRKGYVESGFCFRRYKNHEDNNIYLKMKNIDDDETYMEVTVDEAASMIHVLSAAILDKTSSPEIRKLLAPSKSK